MKSELNFNKKTMEETKQKLLKSLLATVRQNKICDSLPAIGKAFDILRKETAEKIIYNILEKIDEQQKQAENMDEHNGYAHSYAIVKESLKEINN